MQLRFNLYFFISFIILFIIELLIALYIHDNFIRPYIGDVLVVILIYCFMRMIFSFSHLQTSIGVLIFSYMVELGQYFNIVYILGLQDSSIARIIIGTSFSFIDLLAYTVGISLISLPLLILFLMKKSESSLK